MIYGISLPVTQWQAMKTAPETDITSLSDWDLELANLLLIPFLSLEERKREAERVARMIGSRYVANHVGPARNCLDERSRRDAT